jgi:hypothetical protein
MTLKITGFMTDLLARMGLLDAATMAQAGKWLNALRIN